MRVFVYLSLIFFAGCASGTAGTGIVDGSAVSIEITEVSQSRVLVTGYSVSIDGEFIGVFDCGGVCSSELARGARLNTVPVSAGNGIYTLQRVNGANSIFFELALNGALIGTVRFF